MVGCDMKMFVAAACFVAASAGVGSASTVNFNFGSHPANLNQDMISRTVDGVTLDVSGVRCRDGRGPNHRSCDSTRVDEWGTGIGIWTSWGDSHQVDGYHSNEFLKLTLNAVMTLATSSFTYYSPNDDFVAYGWNALTERWDHIVNGDACTSHCGSSSTVHTYDFGPAAYTSNMFMIGSRGSDDDWKFEGASFTSPAVVPLPAAGWLLLAGIGGLAALKRRKNA